MASFLDLACCPEHAVESLYKAIIDEPPEDSIWAQHPSPMVRRLVELFSQRGLDRLEKVRSELSAWLVGERFRAAEGPIVRPPPSWRWDPSDLSLARIYLESLPPAEFTIDDWMMVVDYLVQRYLPEDSAMTEAQWLSTRSVLMGRLLANRDRVTVAEADRVLAKLPNTADAAEQAFGLTPPQRAAMDYGRARAAENITRVSGAVRSRLKSTIIAHEEQRAMGAPVPGSTLEMKLFDDFAELNRDWRRIAVTEVGEMANQGVVASLPEGSIVKRTEQYAGACPFCRNIDGRVMTVVSASKPDKDGETEVWPGKTNVGRSAAPRKRAGGVLVERPDSERWWIAAGVQHPHCRGTWIPQTHIREGDDPEFQKWLDATLGLK